MEAGFFMFPDFRFPSSLNLKVDDTNTTVVLPSLLVHLARSKQFQPRVSAGPCKKSQSRNSWHQKQNTVTS